MNGREGFKAMNAKVIVLPKRGLNYKLKLVSSEDWEKRFEFFWALAKEKTQIRSDLPPLLSQILLRFSLLMIPFQSVFWSSLYILLTLLFARYSLFYLYLFLFSFAFLSPYYVYFNVFQTFLRVFLDSLYAFYFLLSLVALSLSFRPMSTQNPFSTNLN